MTDEYIPAKYAPLEREKTGLLKDLEGHTETIAEHQERSTRIRTRIAQINNILNPPDYCE